MKLLLRNKIWPDSSYSLLWKKRKIIQALKRNQDKKIRNEKDE